MFPTKVTAAFLTASTIFAVSAVRAQDATPAKIAFVDVEKAVIGIAEGKARLQELQDWSKPRQLELQKLSEEITNLQGKISAGAATGASDVDLAALNQQLKVKQREFEDRQRNGRRDFEARQNVILKDIGAKLNKVIAEYADANRYTAVFILKPNDVAYLANSADITDTIVKLYDEKNPYPPPQSGATGK